MNPSKPALDAGEEIPALIETLLITERRLEELTGGEVDMVAGRDGRTFTLRRAQEQLRQSEAGKQAAILDALPAHIALLDAQGLVTSVNEAWRRFANANVLPAPGQGMGLNYLDICDRAHGDHSSEAHQVADGIRKVLDGGEQSFSMEYPCHSPTEQRWFLLTVTPLADHNPNGVVVMHLNITERKRSEEELHKTHGELLATSRRAGMAEVATSVLHNVGNVLNSVNVASSCLADSLRRSKSANLSKVVTMLREHEGDLAGFLTSDPKGKQIPGYLSQLAKHLADEQAAALKELAGLQKNIEHIKEIVAMQQSFGNVSGVVETMKITDLVDDALAMNAEALTSRDIQTIREYEEVPRLAIDKHNVLQILMNLIRNARHAYDGAGCAEKRLTVHVSKGDQRVRISISDNGIGIPAENLARIFNHGFTTKKLGHGYGLHSAALAAKAMGGSLSVHSDGSGKGAVFTLELPLDQEPSAKLDAA